MPCDSKQVGLHVASLDSIIDSSDIIIDMSCIERKCLRFSLNDGKIVLVPLVHSELSSDSW